jgi:hypothetical protein
MVPMAALCIKKVLDVYLEKCIRHLTFPGIDLLDAISNITNYGLQRFLGASGSTEASRPTPNLT